MTDQVHQFWLGEPVMPSDFRWIGTDGFHDYGLMKTEPVRAERALAQELEHETRASVDTELFRQLPCSSLLIRLGYTDCAPDHPVELPWEEGDIVWTTVDENPPSRVATDDGRDPMQPPVTDCLPPVHDRQHLVLLVNPLNKLAHEATR